MNYVDIFHSASWKDFTFR